MSSEPEGPSSGPNTSGLKPWPKGQSGNPNGRKPKGLATVEKLREALAADLPEILKDVVTKAKAGDAGAQKLILERVLPPIKAIELPAYMDEPLEGSLTEQGAAILRAMSAGLLAPGQAAQLIGALAAQAKIAETDDLARRIGELEKQLQAGKQNELAA